MRKLFRSIILWALKDYVWPAAQVEKLVVPNAPQDAAGMDEIARNLT